MKQVNFLTALIGLFFSMSGDAAATELPDPQPLTTEEMAALPATASFSPGTNSDKPSTEFARRIILPTPAPETQTGTSLRTLNLPVTAVWSLKSGKNGKPEAFEPIVIDLQFVPNCTGLRGEIV